ncbi:hypothetical protein KAI04_00655 [Candidatus Pacearchaeota archaeon]|nr:hypothetical protein [Candidatus Pacearchaeota archaeon]
MKTYKILCEKDLERLASTNKGLLELNLDPTKNAWPASPEKIKGRIYEREDIKSEITGFIFAYCVGDYAGIGRLQTISSNLVMSSELRAFEFSEGDCSSLMKWSNFIYEKDGELHLKQKFRNTYDSFNIMNDGKAYEEAREKLEGVKIFASKGKCN